MPERTGQVEQYAQRIWGNRTGISIEKIAKEYGPIDHDLKWTSEWTRLPETLKDYLRGMAEKEIAFMRTLPSPSEMEQYLTILFRELEHLRPTQFGVISHGIAWDKDWDRLVLLVNIGDAAYLQPLLPGDLTADPVATAVSLAAKPEPEDAVLISIKQ